MSSTGYLKPVKFQDPESVRDSIYDILFLSYIQDLFNYCYDGMRNKYSF